MIKYSFIMPVYNAEHYLKRSINSVLSQSIKDWELIVIDDGSSDNSANIINQFSSTDSRIRYFYQSNSGPGMARNNGILKAIGMYIAFIDADDYISDNYLELVDKCFSRSADIVFLDVQRTETTGKEGKVESMSRYSHYSKDWIIRSTLTGLLPWGGVRKIVRKEIIINNGIFYTNHKIGEEALFTFKALTKSNSFEFAGETPVYFYELHPNSQSNLKTDDPWGGIAETIRDYAKEANVYTQYADTINSLIFASTIVSIDRISRNYPYGRVLKDKMKSRLEAMNSSLDKNYPLDMNHLVYKAKVFYPFILKRFWLPVYLISKLRSLFI